MNGKKVLICMVVLFMIGLVCYSADRNVLWKVKEKGEPFSVLFSEENSKVIFIKSDGYVCYNLQTGKKEWNLENILLFHTPTVLNNKLFAKTTENNITSIDINTGECMNTYNVDGRVTLVQAGVDNLLYFVSKKDYISTLTVLNLFTGVMESLFQFEGDVGKQIIIGKDTLSFSADISFGEGKIFCINKNTGELKWEKKMYSRGRTTKLADFDEKIFFVDLQKEIKNRLVEVDIQTGTIVNRIQPKESEWFSYTDYVNNPTIDFDEENVLLFGDYFFLYNAKSNELTKLIKIPQKGYSSILNNGKVIYHDAKMVYSFSIEEKTIKEIYKLNKKEVYSIDAVNEFVLLILSDNINEALANGRDFTYVMLQT